MICLSNSSCSNPLERPTLPPLSDILPVSPGSETFLSRVKQDFSLWISEWESVDFFEYYISSTWRGACRDGDEAILDWSDRMNGKMETGKKILRHLKDEILLDSEQMKEAYDLLSEVHRGLALLEVWVRISSR
jgi:hypothetical protein